MKYLLGLLLLLLSARVSAQKIQEFSHNKLFAPVVEIPRLRLPAPNVDSLLSDDAFREKNGDFYRIGVARTVDLNTENSGVWTTLPNGFHQWCLTVVSPDAQGLSFVFNRFVLGSGSTFNVYDISGKPVYDQLTSANNQEHQTQHIELCEGAELTLVLTTTSRNADLIDLGRVFHIYRGIHGPEKDYGDAESCEVNVNCSPVGDNWQDEKRGIARVLLVIDSEQGYCSGSLINNLAGDCKPYFLTAQHCGVGASTSDFNQWRFFFAYESPNCSNSSPGTPSSRRIEGCVLISNSLGVTSQAITSSDFLLLQLGTLSTESSVISKLKSSDINAYWNGWDANNVASTGGVGIHHPAGDIKKISTFSGTPASTNYSSGASNTHWRVQWTSNTNGYGVTEGGSSGSPVFNLNNGSSRIVGTLSGGSSDCSAQSAYDLYGKFSYDWTSNGTAAERQLKPYLDPGNTGLLTMDGSSNPCGIHANFTANPTTQAPGGTVAFTDLSTGNPSSWNWSITPATGWSYSSGSSSSSQNPEVLFTTEGQYTVKLVVSNGYQSDSLTRVNYITITLANNPCVGTSIECDEFISNVSLNTLNQSSGCDNYTSYSEGTALNAGSSYSISITPQIGSTAGTAYNGDEIAAWIDYNGDYDFEDPDEQIAFLSIYGSFNSTFPFTVPSSAIPGVHTMRVRIAYNSGSTPIVPCGTTEYGEVEDYEVTISESLGLATLSDDIRLYPNPAISEAVFSAGSHSGLLTITDSRGSVVSQLQVSGEQKCDISAFTAGVYYFEFVSDSLKIVKKLVKL